MREHRDKPVGYVQPTVAELRARQRRNWAIAGGLLAFMVLAFLGGLANAGVF